MHASAARVRFCIILFVLTVPRPMLAQSEQLPIQERAATLDRSSCDITQNYSRTVHQLDPDRISDKEDIKIEVNLSISAGGNIISADLVSKNANNKVWSWFRREILNCKFKPEIVSGIPTAIARNVTFVLMTPR